MKTARNRFPRLATGAIVPAVIFALIASLLVSLGINLPPIPEAFGSLPGLMSLILSGWILTGLQCLTYSVIMEFVINPKIKNQRLIIITSGVLLSLVAWSAYPTGIPITLIIIGFTVGLIVGYLLQDMYHYYS